jgi:phosphoglucomutase
LRALLPDLPGTTVEGMAITSADDFAYEDPVDGSTSRGQGLRVVFEGGSRIVLRLSGTGTEGATLRLYLERYAAGPEGLDAEAQTALAPMIRAAEKLATIRTVTGRGSPDVVT